MSKRVRTFSKKNQKNQKTSQKLTHQRATCIAYSPLLSARQQHNPWLLIHLLLREGLLWERLRAGQSKRGSSVPKVKAALKEMQLLNLQFTLWPPRIRHMESPPKMTVSRINPPLEVGPSQIGKFRGFLNQGSQSTHHQTRFLEALCCYTIAN